MSNRAVCVPLVTPLDDAGAVCRQSVSQLLACSRDTASGYVPCLTSGEGWLLSRSQWEAMARFTLELAGPRDVIVGIERATTEEVIEYAERAQRLGARAVMLTAPFKRAGHAIEPSSIFEHYRRVHDASDLAIYLYNESSLSGHVTSFETLLAIAELPRVGGIKDSVHGGRDASQIAALQRHGLAYYVGWEHHLAKGLPVDGCVVSLANLEPALCRIGLTSAHPAVDAEIVRLTEAYSLLSEDWYRHLKRALKVRGVIASDRTVASWQEAP